MPQFSEDDVVNFVVTEAVLLKLNDAEKRARAEAEKQAKLRQFRQAAHSGQWNGQS